MNFDDLNTFVIVVDAGSITAAAKVLEVPKSKVSRHMARLEEALGARLLERSTRSQRLTELGEGLYRRVKPLFDELGTIQDYTRELSGQPCGQLVLSLPDGLAQALLLPRLAIFYERYPDITLKLDISAEPRRLMVDGVDMALRATVAPLQDSNLVASRLFSTRRHVVYSPRQFGRLTAKQGMAIIRKLPAVTLPDEYQWQFDKADPGKSYRLRRVFVASEMMALLNAAREGIGFAAVPRYLAAEHIASGELAILDLPHALAPSHVYALYQQRHLLAPKVKAMLEFLREITASMDEITRLHTI